MTIFINLEELSEIIHWESTLNHVDFILMRYMMF